MTATDTTDVTRVERIEDAPDGVPEWRAWIPPRGPQDYEGGDPDEGAVLAPYGSSYWFTPGEAIGFVVDVTGEPPVVCPPDDPTITIAITAAGATREHAIEALEEAVARVRAGLTSGHDRSDTSRFEFTAGPAS